MTTDNKSTILNLFKEVLENKITVLRKRIESLMLDAQNDAKGSAGDKHETALAMMHLEQEKLNQKLSEALDQQNILKRIKDAPHQTVASGSLVETSKGWFYVCTALPVIQYENKQIFAVSPQAPIGKLLLGKNAGSSVTFNGTQFDILNVV